MRYRPQELVHWQNVQDFLAPNNRVDPDAMRLYLAQYSQLNASETYPDDMDATALGVVLKHAELSIGDAVVTAFVTYYEEFRLRQLQPYNEDENAPLNHVSFDEWLEDMAESRPDDLEMLLRQAADVLNVNHQAMVLRDAQKWLPHCQARVLCFAGIAETPRECSPQRIQSRRHHPKRLARCRSRTDGHRIKPQT